MTRARVAAGLAVLVAVLLRAAPAPAQLASLETANQQVVYLDPAESFIAEYVARCFENSLAFHKKLFDYTPSERMSVFLTDFSDFGNAGASSVPRDGVTVKIAPMSFAFETFTANERMNYLMNHELVHVVVMDQAAKGDVFFRRLFQGKVAPVSQHPESVLYFYLTSPRVAAPRWYQEGIAVFLDTWMAGGLGRAQGPYDEMVFRSMVRDGTRFYDPLGLASELTKVDFRLEANSYLYGGRFMNYLAYRYAPESLLRWISRKNGTRAYYASQFREVFGKPLNEAWQEWIAFEHEFQQTNLARIREHPLTPFKDVSRQALGSLSRAYLDRDARQLYAGVNYPGIIGHLAAISLADGSVEKIHDIKEPRLHTVTSLAYDPASKTLFYTGDNTAYRDLMAIDPATKKERTLLKDARIGDLAFNQVDSSLWGIRVFNGICTLVRIPQPYTEWNQVHSWPYGEIAYDLDVSPDGQLVSASIGEINGRQSLRVMSAASLLKGDTTAVARFDFGTAIPSNFVFSPDSRYLFGSSYYTGVSNIFRYELATNALEALTNTDGGFFRPIPLEGNSLLVFRYTGEGFVPSIVEGRPLEDVNPISFLGHEVVQKHPVLKEWIAGSPADVAIEPLVTRRRPYRPLRELDLESIYPVVEGYKDSVAYGLHVRFSDPLLLNGASLSASYSPDAGLRANERLHLQAEYQRYEWKARAQWNAADFYDLFGPTKTGRKGYGVGLGYLKTLVYDAPRQLDAAIDGTFYGGLDTLPEFQNVAAPFEKLLTARARLSFKDLRSSLGSVDDEKGVSWNAVLADNHANGRSFPRLLGDLDAGMALPWGHSSVWVRSAAGVSRGDRDEPFANFYFGGFGNNWIDHGDEKRYREYYSFPGVDLNAIGGRNFVKSIVEWNLPPVHFSRAGSPGFYVSWARPAIFVGGLLTNIDEAGVRQRAGTVGAQLDFRFTVFSSLDMTFSLGAAAAAVNNGRRTGELMLSLKVLQ